MALNLGAVANKRKTKNKIVVKKNGKIENEDVTVLTKTKWLRASNKFNTIETTNLFNMKSKTYQSIVYLKGTKRN
jgi:hypothetical protein